MGDSITEGTVLSLAKKVGDHVALEEVFAEVETDKVTVEIRSPQAGTIKAIHVEVGATVEVGSKFYSLAVGEGEPAAPAAEAPAPAAAAPAPSAAPSSAPPPPKPAAPAPPKATAPLAPSKAAAPAAAADAGSRETRVAMTRIRKRTAQRLKESQEVTASLTTFNEVDMTAITEMRKKYQVRGDPARRDEGPAPPLEGRAVEGVSGVYGHRVSNFRRAREGVVG